MTWPTLGELYADSDNKLWRTQEQYESHVRGYLDARDKWSQSVLDYEGAFSAAVERIKKDTGKGEGITVIKELAKNSVLKEYGDMLKSEHLKKRYRVLADMYGERLNTIKALMRIKKEG